MGSDQTAPYPAIFAGGSKPYLANSSLRILALARTAEPAVVAREQVLRQEAAARTAEPAVVAREQVLRQEAAARTAEPAVVAREKVLQREAVATLPPIRGARN